jgi:signal transduction histidine kinase
VIEAAIYYVVAETLTNAAKHGGASEAHVELATTGDAVIVEIRDNGGGERTSPTAPESAGSPTGSKRSAESSNSIVGAGTVVRTQLPLR